MLYTINPVLLVDIGIAAILWIVAYFLVRKLINKYIYFIGSGVLLTLAALSLYFNLKIVSFIILVLLLSCVVGILIMCQSELSKLLKTGLASKLLVKHGSSLKEKDENLLFVELNKSILELSESKTGAIIVIERDVNLQNFIDDGISVHQRKAMLLQFHQ